jgi:pilus assembly protein CpaE
VTDAIRIFISGSCAGLAEVRQALSSHDAIKVVGTAVDAPSAGDRLREEQVDVLLHGSSRGDRLPTQDIHTLQSASAAPIVIVTSGCTPEFLQEALAHGVQDVAILPQLTESLVFTLRRAHVLNHNQPRAQAPSPALTRSGGEGRVITVFSPKGGVGKSTISTGLAGAYCHGLKRSTLLIDLDLQFGDVGIMMGIDPAQTIVDLVTTTGELDPDKLGGYVVHHASGMDVLAAPLRPEDAELVTEDRIGQLIDVAKSAYDIVVLDTPPHFDATTLAALDRSDRLVLVATMDIPTVKNCKLALQTLNLLQYPRERIALVVNRPLGRADLREGDISRTLDMPISAVIPLDKEIATAVNRGVPVTVSASRSPAAKSMRDLAEQLLPPVSSAEAKAASKNAGAESKAQKRNAPKLPSPGRQSVLKAGMSRFSKSKDKKAA